MPSLTELASGGEGALAVLCGGPGGEREVSLASGECAHRALLRAGVANRMIVVPEAEPEFFLENIHCRAAVMMLHGLFGEDGTAQAILERRGIGYSGSAPATCRLAMDKDAAKREFLRRGIPTPKWVCAGDATNLGAAVRDAGLTYPLFVKPNCGGSSVGAGRVTRAEELPAAVGRALAAGGGNVIAEEMVAGAELTVGWFEGRTLPIVELVADGEFYDYHAKYQSDATGYICPAELPADVTAQVQSLAERAVGCLSARDLARVDVMLGPAGPMVLEVNALPGFTTHSLLPMAAARAGIPLENLCVRLAELAASRAGPIGIGS